MNTQDILLENLIINKLTQAQYNTAKAQNQIKDNQLYLVKEDFTPIVATGSMKGCGMTTIDLFFDFVPDMLIMVVTRKDLDSSSSKHYNVSYKYLWIKGMEFLTEMQTRAELDSPRVSFNNATKQMTISNIAEDTALSSVGCDINYIAFGKGENV